MFLRKLSAGSVEALCMACQVWSEYALVDMKAANRSVSFPSCPACHKVRLQVNVTAGPIAKVGEAALSQAWIKALHRQLIVDGHTAAIYSAEKVAPDAHDGAVDWPTGDAVVDFVVTPVSEP
jgi:hypothetical protein